MAENEITLEKIANNGDLILTIGSPAKVKLLVLAEMLIRASSVFAALLGPRFREGQWPGTSTNPKRVDLLEDDGPAMSIMCNLLHGNKFGKQDDPRTIESPLILGLALAIDKYACTWHLHWHMRGLMLQWFELHNTASMFAYARIATASYLVQESCCFTRATHSLMWSTSKQCSDLFKEHFVNYLPTKAILAIEQKRNQAYTMFTVQLPELGMPPCLAHTKQGFGSEAVNYDRQYMDSLCKIFGVPYWLPNFREKGWSVRDLNERIKSIGIGRRNTPTCQHTGKKTEVSALELKNFSEKLAKACNGLCLHCIKEGKADPLSECADKEHDWRG